MAIRTGKEYINAIKNDTRAVFIDGKRVTDLTEHPSFQNVIKTISLMYDMQHDPILNKSMTYVSPSTGDPVGLSFIVPHTVKDLELRRNMMTNWARATLGMIGRSPDSVNVIVMAMAAASDHFGTSKELFKNNIEAYYEYIRENDLSLANAIVNSKRSRSTNSVTGEDEIDLALKVVRETDAGIVVSGARRLVTLGPLADELLVYPSRTSRLPGFDYDSHALVFAIPSNTHGLKFICREGFDIGRSKFDHPLGSRFEEIDAIAVFENVVVPWERVFLMGDVRLHDDVIKETNLHAHYAHQVVTRLVVKCEFVLGIATNLVDTLGSEKSPEVRQLIAELIEYLEVTRASLKVSEMDARVDKWGVMCPAELPLTVAENMFTKVYPRMIEIIQLLGSSNLLSLPSETDLFGPVADDVKHYLATDSVSGEERMRLLHLAWDSSCSAFASRQVMFERFFHGGPIANATRLYDLYDLGPANNYIKEFLNDSQN